MTFGQFARQKRKQHNISQDTVAQALGYEHRSNIYRLETDQLEWKLSSVMKLAELFGMTVSELMKEFDDIQPVHQ